MPRLKMKKYYVFTIIAIVVSSLLVVFYINVNEESSNKNEIPLPFASSMSQNSKSSNISTEVSIDYIAKKLKLNLLSNQYNLSLNLPGNSESDILEDNIENDIESGKFDGTLIFLDSFDYGQNPISISLYVSTKPSIDENSYTESLKNLKTEQDIYYNYSENLSPNGGLILGNKYSWIDKGTNLLFILDCKRGHKDLEYIQVQKENESVKQVCETVEREFSISI